MSSRSIIERITREYSIKNKLLPFSEISQNFASCRKAGIAHQLLDSLIEFNSYLFKSSNNSSIMTLQNILSQPFAGGRSLCALDTDFPPFIKARHVRKTDYAYVLSFTNKMQIIDIYFSDEVYTPAADYAQIKIEADEYVWRTPTGPFTLATLIPSHFNGAEEFSVIHSVISSAPVAPIAQPSTDHPEPHLFAKLPTELKMMIFELARPDPRVIKPLFSKKDGRSLYSTAKVPALLHVCSLSRTIAKKWYSLGLPTVLAKGKTYFDLERDYLYLCDPGRCGCPNEKCVGDAVDLEFTDRVNKIATELPTAKSQPYWWYIEFMHKHVKEIMLVNAERGMLGDVAGIERFTEVEEEKVLGKSKYLDARDAEMEKEKAKGGEISTFKWTIEHAWRANFVGTAL